MNYIELIKETIKENPSLNINVIEDVLKRCNDWMEYEGATPSDDYIKKQYEYLCRYLEHTKKVS